ncbi:MarC family protein [Bythopirellula goksoeyrii]|uniref:UPF0056 membrane protein n=1 Tax=Bythopirellula goksoeyrii TaxID=1400387 RepID=A0A5B9Q3I2_9BACT|nr:MarC family protein [Bythopirellula goksoeyrii]QEG33554.1 inner membrane protein [Bythopirellula goksoeyrii]
MELQLQAIATVLALVNPVMCGAIFMRVEGNRPRRDLLIDATMASLTVLVILILAALVGTRILHLFGVSLDAFSVAGGGVLSWIGFSMLSNTSSEQQQETRAEKSQKPSLAPLILFAASPGTITGVITLAAAHGKNAFPVTALVAVVVAAIGMWLWILLAISMGSHTKGGGLVRSTATQFMGLIVIAMGIQFVLTGIREFFAH